MIKEYWMIVSKGLKHRKLRAWLTMLGIVIGITAIVSLITLGQGLENAVTGQFDKFGSNRIFVGSAVMSGFGAPSGEGTLTRDDYDVLRKIPQLEYVDGMRSETAKIVYGNEEVYKSVNGVTLDNAGKGFDDLGIEYLDGGDLKSNNDVVIGYRTAKEMFDKEVRLRTKLKINDEDFRVVGILEEQGDSGTDNYVMIPIEKMWELYDDESFSALTAVVNKGIDMDRAEKIVTRRLERSRGDENFVVTNPQKVSEQISEMLGVVQWVLAGIAFISILVGGLGIMNSMYTSVMERTKQVGTMKAVGARNSFILGLFLFESGLMGLVGGLVGVILGLLIAKGLEAALVAFGYTLLKITVSWSLIVFGLGFSFFIGVGSGMLPAYKASQLNVVDALRYE